MKKLFFILLFLFNFDLYSQGLIVNEISNGAAGNQEYYELVVIGSSTNPLGNVNLGGWIIDDNNGSFEGTATTGIATGHIRIRPGYLPSVKPGSIILIYNSAELSFVNDSTDSNLDCVYILPITSTFFEFFRTLPSTTNSSYSPATYDSLGSWTGIALANSGDAAQVRKPDGNFYHGFSYGDVTDSFPNFPSELGGLSSFNIRSGTGANRNYFFGCGNFTSVGTFRRGSAVAPTEETPGQANNDFNRYFINALRNGTYDYSNLSNPSNCGSSTTLTPCDFILPIEITYFRTEKSYSGSIVEWRVENIKDIEYFELEKSSDGYFFETIDITYSIENILEYTYVDYLNSSDNYYRLKVTENNSEVTYSKIIYVQSDDIENISIYPNPSSGKIFIKSDKSLENLNLYDIFGKFLYNINVVNNEIDLSLPSGLYYVQIENNFYKIRIFK